MMPKLKVICTLMLSAGLVACGEDESSSLPLAQAQHVSPTETSRVATLEADVETLLAQLTAEEKVSLVHANSKFAIASVERLGIHEMWMSDGPHGVRQEISRDSWNSAGWSDDQSTYLPPLTAVAASWNPEMASLHGNVLGSEARHRRKDVILGPGVNLARLPLYGRNFEYLGEDPYLAAKLVVPEIKAIQANDVAATIKHYALNTQELNRHGVNAKPDERTLREVYLPAFEAGVKQGGVHAVMGAYNNFRGTNANQSKHLVNDILKTEWGFSGLLVTDWDVNINTYDAAMNGLDIEMGTRVKSYDDYHFGKPLLAMVKSGKVPMAVLDDKVRRILRVQHSIGMMDKQRLSGQRNTAEHRAAAKQIIDEGIVLLKNDKVLPLDTNAIKNILVLGPNANKAHGAGGGSSQVKSLYEITPLAGLKEIFANSDVNVTLMRAQSDAGLMPIAGDYVVTRHAGTGTPAWRLIHYSDDSRQKSLHWAWLPDSAYSSPVGADTEFVTMKANIKPLQSGVHTLKLAAVGEFSLTVNGKEVLKHQGKSSQVIEHNINLDIDKEYQFTIKYNGHDKFVLGWDAPGSLFASKTEYMAAAKNADAVVYFGGLSHADDRESKDRSDMLLPNLQDAVITDLLNANPNTIVVMNAGSAVEMPWADKAKAIVWGWYGGMEAGRSYAEMLTGKINPSGKMPITLPKKLADTAAIALNDYNADEALYKEGVFIGHRWFEQQNIAPLFPFGHGLSYTTFSYDNVELSSLKLTSNEELQIKAKITNTGEVAGAEIVQLYLHDIEASVARPVKELKGFTKVWLEPGESQTVTLTLSQRDLSFWDETSNNWLAEPGIFEVLIGASHDDIQLSSRFNFY